MSKSAAKKMEKIAILYQASQGILSTFELDEVLKQILITVRDHFHVPNAAVLLLDSDRNELYVRQHLGRGSESNSLRVPIGSGITGSAAHLKSTLNIGDVDSDPRYICGTATTRSELAVPLLVRGEAVGVLDIQSTELNAFDEATVAMLTMFSNQASIAIENARLYSLVEKRATQLEAINAIARQATAVLVLEELLPKLCELVHDHFDAAHVAVFLKDKSGLQLRSHMGKLSPYQEEHDLRSAKGLAAIAFRTGAPVREHDLANNRDLEPAFKGAQSELCLPLIFYGEKLGVLALEGERPQDFSKYELDALTAVADIFAVAIKNCQHFEAARQLAYRDGLTGVFNRRFFEERIFEEIERCKRYNTELAVLMIDIDQFKAVNDNFGHMLGDEVLKEVAQIFIQQLRKTDVVCRYGGEEFVILLPQLSADRVLEVAEKLRRLVHACPFPGVAIPVSISIGIAHLPENGDSRDELIAAADSALYAAKQSGRNTVLLAPAPRLR